MTASAADGYGDVLSSMVDLVEAARRTSARAVNSIMTATYWEIGRRIVELEQGGEGRAEYGSELISRISADLTKRFGKGFGVVNVASMRRFFLLWLPERMFQTPSEKSDAPMLSTLSAKLSTMSPTPHGESSQTPSGGSTGVKPASPDRIFQTPSEKLPTVSAKLQTISRNRVAALQSVAALFPLPWSHYVKLLSVEDENARRFYEKGALRGGWTVRQLDRQISSQFYERTLLSKNKAAMLRKGAEPQADDLVTPEEEIKDPLVLEFLDLKDEYSGHDLEEALIHKLEDFLLELGGDFAFIGRQKRLRIGDEWYRIDLLFFHRRLKCLVVIDLKIGKFTHADAGQMHLYLNYAREHWTNEGENPPVGLILCAQKDEAVAHYSLEGLPNKVMASQYRLALPAEAVLTKELEKTQRALEQRGVTGDSRQRTPPPKRTRKKSSKRKA